MDTDTTNEAEKKEIEAKQKATQEQILEPDEAAQSAEGMSNQQDDLRADVAEDRDATPPRAADLPEESIVQ